VPSPSPSASAVSWKSVRPSPSLSSPQADTKAVGMQGLAGAASFRSTTPSPSASKSGAMSGASASRRNAASWAWVGADRPAKAVWAVIAASIVAAEPSWR